MMFVMDQNRDQTPDRTMRISARILGLMALALLFSASLLQAEESPGKKTFLALKCNLCHGVEAAEIEAKTKSEKMAGGDLSRVVTEENREEMRTYVLRESSRDDKEHKKEFKGTEEELQAILEWLAELAAAAQAEG